MLYDDHMQRFAWASELFFKECPKAPAELLQVFSYVCANNGCQKLQVEKALGLSSSAGSRQLNWLANKHEVGNGKPKKPGLRLIELRKGYDDWRSLRCHLTDKGHWLSQEMKALMWPDEISFSKKPAKPDCAAFKFLCSEEMQPSVVAETKSDGGFPMAMDLR